jgi:hypothetical protein
VRSAWNRWPEWAGKKSAESPFLRLLGHFVHRSLRGGAESDSEELDFSTGLLLMLLPVPGTFVSILFYDKYSTLLQLLRRDLILDPYTASLGDEYLFIVVSMVLTGVIAVWRWDSILLDRRDFANLVHLPVSAWKLFLSNLMAILFLTMLFAFEVNIGSTALFPIVVSASYPEFSIYRGFAVGHALGVGLASVFTFAAVVAWIGLLMFCLPYRVFRRFSQYLRIALVVCFLFLLMTSFAVGHLTPRLTQDPLSIIRFLPPVWFLGLCETLRHTAAPVYRHLGMLALLALAGTLLFAGAAYALSYRRCFLSIPETVEATASRSPVLLPVLLGVADRWYLPTAARRACFAFVVRTLTRSEKHFTALGAFVGMGLLLCAQTLVSAAHGGTVLGGRVPAPALLSIPLILVYCVVVGLRFIFEIPADLRANWIFKLQIDAGAGESVALGRALAWTMLAPLLILACVPAYVYVWGWQVAVPHLGYVGLMTALLVETMIAGLRKIPFTCSLPVFKEHAFVLLFLLFLGFYLFVRAGAFLESVVFFDPVRVIIPGMVLAGWWLTIRQYRANQLAMDKQIIFEEGPVEAVQLLDLDTRG